MRIVFLLCSERADYVRVRLDVAVIDPFRSSPGLVRGPRGLLFWNYRQQVGFRVFGPTIGRADHIARHARNLRSGGWGDGRAGGLYGRCIWHDLRNQPLQLGTGQQAGPD